MRGKILVVALVAIMFFATASWFLFLREGNPIGGQGIIPPAPAEVQQSTKPSAPENPALPSLAERRAQREKEATEEEKFREPPQIKLPDFSGSRQEAKKEEAEGGLSGLGRIWGALTFPIRAVAWISDNFWLVVIIILAVAHFSGSAIGKIFTGPLNIAMEVFQTIIPALWLKKSIFDRDKKTDENVGNTKKSPRKKSRGKGK